MSEAIHYVVLVPSMVPLAVNFYIEVFQATKISDNDDGSVQLRINDSNVLVTPGTPSNSLLIELVLDRDSRQKIRQDARFVEIEREQDVETDQTSVKMRDPYGVFWLLNEKEYSDIYRCIVSCENCNLERHLPALCDEMKAWYYYVDIYNHIDACEICKLELHPPALCEIMKTWSSFQFASFSAKKTFQTYRTLQEEMSQIRNLRFSYESEDFDLFTNHPTVPLRAIFDELESINSFRQALAVTLFFNPLMRTSVSLLEKWNNSVSRNAPLVFQEVCQLGCKNPENNPHLLSLRSDLCDCFRQLVKRMQSGIILMNKIRLGISNEEQWCPTPQEGWMVDILYKDVKYWRSQYY